MENSHGGEKRIQNQQGGSGSLWSNQDEMRRYVSKLKSELAEQKNRVKRVHRDKAEEIKRLQENLDYEKQKAIENVSKKLESDKVYELKKMKESVVRQKENELRQVLRVKDEEMRALKLELQENKNTSRILELENKRIISEQARGSELNDNEKRLKSEVSSLRNEKRRLEESLRIKSEADFEKAELIRQMKQEHNSEIRRLTRESKRESLKEFRQLKAVSREVELKNHQLAAKEADLRRLEREKNHLGNELNFQRRGSLKKNNSFNSQKTKGLSASQNSESDFESVAEDRIKKLKMRNSELVIIARKLEEKAKQLQEEKDLLEKSSEMNNPELGNLKKAFVKQRAKDLAERAKLLMNKDNEINNLKKEVEETQKRHNGINENGCVEELDKIVQQSSKERLLLEKQVSLKMKSLEEEIKDVTVQNTRLTNDNDVLKEHVSKLQDFESKYHRVVCETKEIKECNERLEKACSEKDKRLYKLELERQTYTAENDALQQKNTELLSKLEKLSKVEQEYSILKDKVDTLINEKHLMEEEITRLRREIERFSDVTKDIEKLKQENSDLETEKNNALLKLEERNEEISSLYQAQEFAQRKHCEELSEVKEMLERVKEQEAKNDEERKQNEIRDLTNSVLTSTPKDSKCTQTSRPSSPVISPIIHNGMRELQDNQQDEEEEASLGQDLLSVPYNGTSSSTSFDLENAGTRIQQLAASDSDDYNDVASIKSESLISSEISECSEGTSDEEAMDEIDTSYSADVSQASDLEEADKTLNKQESDHKDPRENPDIYIGSPLEDLEEKLSIFIAKYNYDPMLYSPNDNPEMELAFQAGDYLYVYGDIDEDGFYVGELMNGDRGLVPSNFVERIAEDEAILKESDEIDDDYESEDDSSDEEITLKDEDGKRKVIRPKAFSERRHEWFRSSLDHVLTDQLDDIRESDEDGLATSSHSEDELDNRKYRNDKRNKPEVDQASSEGLDSMDSDIPEPRIPSPTKLSLDRQFTNSALISWRGAQLPSEEIQGYNIYVDGKLKTRVKGCKKTNAVVEDIKPTETYRLSVRTKSVKGMESHDNEATMVFGPDAKLSPANLCVRKITATSVEIQWLPAHSSYLHEVLVNDSLLECIKPGFSSYTINDLTPATIYQVQVRTLIPDHLKFNMDMITENDLTAETEFQTAEGGLPEPPVDLRLAQRTSENILLTWLPVTLSKDGYSNGYRVSTYKIYVNNIYCTETVSACADSIEISMERLRNLRRRNDFSRMRFVARTLSVLGESVDSNVVVVRWDDSQDLPVDKKYAVVNHSSKGDDIIKKAEENDSYEKVETVPSILENNVENQEGEPSFSNHVVNKDKCSGNLEVATSSKNSILEKDRPYSEPDGKSTSSENDSDVRDRDMNGNLTNIKLEVGKSATGTADAPATVVRKPPIVTRYEEVETASDSTESKTQDTEEELIERFKHFQISEKDEVSENDVCEHEENKQADKIQEETTKDSTSIHSQEVENLNDGLSEHGNEKPDSGTEGEVSEKPNSLNIDQQSESETDSEDRHAKHFQSLIQNAVSEKQGREPRLNKESIESESDTETEYGPPLSVIDEVDEDNLTDTNNAEKTSDDTASDGEATLSNKQIKSLPTDSFKSSEPSTSRSRTITSDDEGFRTEDDVLDLLDDDEGILGDPKGDERSTRKSYNQPGDKVNKCDNKTSANKDNGDSDVQEVGNGEQRIDNARIAEDSAVVQKKIDSNSEGISDSPSGSGTLNSNILEGGNDKSSLNLPDNASCSTIEGKKNNSNGETTEDELIENLSESSCPTRSSLKSDSTISEDPPEAERALATLMATLTLPSNRETISGESGHSGNMDDGYKGTPEPISEQYRSGSEVSENVSEPVRYFIALYNYDPSSMSPNVDGADEELPFNEGDMIKVFGEKDDDGFFWGECKQKHGFVPSNMIVEMNINEAEDIFNQADNDIRLNNELNSNDHVNGELDVDVISDNLDCKENGTSDRLSFWENLEDDHLGPRKMKALYDYDPLTQSPNVDNEVELQFQAGEIIYVFGGMDEDGFFKGELNGIRGLVPSNFLQPSENNEAISDSSKTTDSSAQKQQSSVNTANNVTEQTAAEENELQHKKKKNIFSKGKKMFKKAFK